MIDVTNYIERKEDGTVEVVAAGGGVAAAFKKWNPDTGELLKPEIQSIDVDELQKEKEALTAKIASIDQLISDITTAKQADVA